MELTSQAINEAEFSMARRGYDPDQVDEFLEKLAVAVDKQNEALAEARERASMAERRAAEAERRLAERPERVVDVAPAAAAAEEETVARSAQLTATAEAELETLQRTLLLAQKTADATIRDAEEEGRRMIAKAEADARAAQEGTRARLLEEIAKLDADRAALQGDVDALEGHLVEQRQHVEATIDDLQRLLSDSDRLKRSDAPALSEVAATGGDAAPAESSRGPEDTAEPATAVAPATPAAGEEEPEVAGPASGTAAEEAPAGPNADDDEGWARFAPGGDADEVDAGPSTQPVLRLDDLDRPSDRGTEGEDAYLSELRKAMLDDRGAPDIDEAYGDDREARQRFGRRR